MVSHARACLPEEACGLIAVDGEGRITHVYPVTNVDRSRVRFTVSPREHYAAIRDAENRGWEIGGSFHSHPESAAFPSARDVEGALDPTWLYFVVGMANGYPEIRGFRIRDYIVNEVALREEM
jgi:proteasome lid subunit RPN8/RPN11